MVSKTLVKLIDYSIFPAVLLVSAKVVGVAFLLKYFRVDYQLDGLRLTLTNVEDYIAVNSYSSLFMLVAVLAGLLWVVVKAHMFHDTHITPSFSARLFGMNLDELIHDTEVIYTQSFIWLSYAWISTLILGVHSLYGLSYWWVFYVALGVSILSTAFLVMDIEREINADRALVKSKHNKSPMVSFEKLTEAF